MSAYANVDGCLRTHICNCTEIQGCQVSLSFLSQLKQERNDKRALHNNSKLENYLKLMNYDINNVGQPNTFRFIEKIVRKDNYLLIKNSK